MTPPRLLRDACLISLLCVSLLHADETAPPVRAGVDALLGELKEDPPISRRDLIDGLTDIGPSAVPHLIQYLNGSPDESALDAIFKAISNMGDENTASHLISLLEADIEAVQIAAINALGRIGTPETVIALTEIMMETEDDDLFKACQAGVIATLRKEGSAGDTFAALTRIADEGGKLEKIRAIHCLGASGSERAGRFLLGFLRDEDMTVTIGTMVALSRLRIDDPRTCSRIRRFLGSRNPYLKKEAALAVGKLKDIESIPDLIDLLNDAHSGVVDTAHWALKQISGMRFSKNSVYWDSWWKAEEEEYREKMNTALEELDSGAAGRQMKAIRSLSRMVLGREEASDVLLRFISDDNPMIRREVCSALGIMKAQEAVPALIGFLDDSSNDVKNAAHRALRRITGQDLPKDRDEWEGWASSQ